MIKWVTMGLVNTEKREERYPSKFINLEGITHDYITKKLSNTIKLSTRQASGNQIDKMLKSYFERVNSSNSEEILSAIDDIMYDLSMLYYATEDSIPFYLFFISYTNESDEECFSILKVDCKKSCKVEDNGTDYILKNIYTTPDEKSTVSESITFNYSKNMCYVIEKKAMIDGKKQYFLADRLGNFQISYEEQFKTFIRVIKKVNEIYKLHDTTDMIGYVFGAICDKQVQKETIDLRSIGEELFIDDENAISEFNVMMNDLNIDGVIDSRFFTKDYANMKIVTDTGIEVKLPVYALESKEYIQLNNNEIVLSEVSNITVK